MRTTRLRSSAILKRGRLIEPSSRRVLRGVATLATGSAAAKLIMLASLPIITRLYAPEHMGALSVFAGLVMLLTPLVTLQYNRGLPVAGRKSAAINLLVLTLALVSGFSLLLTGVLAIGAAPLLHLLSMDVLQPFWWMLPLGTLVMGTYLTLQLWATRERAYRHMAGAEIAHGLATSVGKIGLFLVMPGPLALIMARVGGQSVAALILVSQFRSELRSLARHVTLRRMRSMAVRHQGFPRYRLPSQLTLLMASQMPIFFVASVFGAATAGQFGLAMMALALPMSLIARNTGKAFFGEAAHLGHEDPAALRRAVIEITRILGAVGLVMTMALMLAAPTLFPLVFGAQWAEAGRFAAVLAIFLTAQFVVAPVMNVLTVVRREHIYLQVNLKRLVLTTGVFLAAYLLDLTPLMTILAYSLVLTFHCVVTFLRVLRAIADD